MITVQAGKQREWKTKQPERRGIEEIAEKRMEEEEK